MTCSGRVGSVQSVATEQQQRKTRVAYLLSHFPAISHTFLAEEIRGVEAGGVEVVPIATNVPGPVDLLDEANREWQRRTHYIKGTNKARVVWVFLRTVLRHPSALRLVGRTGGTDLRAYLWRFFYLVEATLVVDVMRRNTCRHLHAHMGGPPSTLAWFATELGNLDRRGPRWTWSLTIHGWSEFVNEDANYLRPKIASARFVACISDYTRSQVLRLSEPADWGKVEVVRCGIDFHRFTARESEPANDVPHVAVIGRLSPEKGHAVLVEAAVRLRERGIAVVLDVVGPDFGMADTMQALAVEGGIAESLVVHGPATPEQVAAILGGADAFCLPTFAEGLPIVIMEAMARRVPVVTTFIAGIPELAIDGETALVVPAGNADALADALQRMLSDDELRRRLVQRADTLVHRRHDITTNVQRLRERFAEATGA